MHGGQSVIESPVEEPQPDQQGRLDPCQTFLKVGVILSAEFDTRQIFGSARADPYPR